MANELRIEAQLEYSKNGVKEAKRDSAYIDVSGDSINKTIQEIATSNTAITAVATVGTYGIPMSLSIHVGITGQVDRMSMAREMGEDVGGLTETTAELFGGLIGITEVLPVANILGKVHKNAPLSIKQKLVSALQSGAAEGMQEVVFTSKRDLFIMMPKNVCLKLITK